MKINGGGISLSWNQDFKRVSGLVLTAIYYLKRTFLTALRMVIGELVSQGQLVNRVNRMTVFWCTFSMVKDEMCHFCATITKQNSNVFVWAAGHNIDSTNGLSWGQDHLFGQPMTGEFRTIFIFCLHTVVPKHMSMMEKKNKSTNNIKGIVHHFTLIMIVMAVNLCFSHSYAVSGVVTFPAFQWRRREVWSGQSEDPPSVSPLVLLSFLSVPLSILYHRVRSASLSHNLLAGDQTSTNPASMWPAGPVYSCTGNSVVIN